MCPKLRQPWVQSIEYAILTFFHSKMSVCSDFAPLVVKYAFFTFTCYLHLTGYFEKATIVFHRYLYPCWTRILYCRACWYQATFKGIVGRRQLMIIRCSGYYGADTANLVCMDTSQYLNWLYSSRYRRDAHIHSYTLNVSLHLVQ